jgi:hypothetical protein
MKRGLAIQGLVAGLVLVLLTSGSPAMAQNVPAAP